MVGSSRSAGLSVVGGTVAYFLYRGVGGILGGCWLIGWYGDRIARIAGGLDVTCGSFFLDGIGKTGRGLQLCPVLGFLLLHLYLAEKGSGFGCISTPSWQCGSYRELALFCGCVALSDNVGKLWASALSRVYCG